MRLLAMLAVSIVMMSATPSRATFDGSLTEEFCEEFVEKVDDILDSRISLVSHYHPVREAFIKKVRRALRLKLARCERILMDDDDDVSPHRPRFRHFFARGNAGLFLGQVGG